MNIKLFVLAVIILMSVSVEAQTLFTYGTYSVDAKDFLRAFDKNNTNQAGSRTQAIRDYLDLYIRSRLKIQEAYNRRYDTLPQIKTEVENLRQQIIENYMNDPESFNKLMNEAFTRSQMDIHIAHIFISSKKADGTTDSITAKQKAEKALQELQKGEPFSNVALRYSDDPAVKLNKGDIGFITVFNLPYTLENIAYLTSPGKFSGIYHSKIGYHIIKNTGERKAIGKIKAQQILLAFPPNADGATKKAIAKRADSLYTILIKGGDMAKLASLFSNDYVSAASGGRMPDFGISQYEPAFENYVFSLPKDGAIGKPFLTQHGYHIVKRISRIPIVTDPENKSNRLEIKSRVEQSDRMQISKNLLYDKVLQIAGFKKLSYDETELWALTDSLIDFHKLSRPVNLTNETKLFSIGNEPSTVAQWAEYAKTYRYKSDGSGYKPYTQVMDEFIQNKAQQYYRDHLEDFNPEFKNQMSEFKDGNLFFEIMQQEIWNKAQTDTAALEKYYADHKIKYKWNQSADAVLFFCSDINISKTVYDQVKKKPRSWKSIIDALGEKVVGDSARYEWSQIPNEDKTELKAGMITKPVVNANDNTASFAYVIKLYPTPQQRSFIEAKGLVINDYQEELEKKWVSELKKKYPVTINQQVLDSISK